jgi:uncharacterized protein
MAKTAVKSGKTTKPGKQVKAVAKVAAKSKPVKGKPVPQKQKPAVKATMAKKTIVKKTVVKKPIVKKPVIKKTAAKKAVVKKPLIKKAEVKKAVIKKAIAKKPEIKKNIIRKPTAQVVSKVPVKLSNKIVAKKGDVELKKVVGKVAEKDRKVEKVQKPEKIEISPEVEKISKADKAEDKADSAIEKKLRALINLQQIDSQIDKIRIIRGELPLEVQDLEDEIAGVQTRIENYTAEVNSLDEAIAEKKNAIKQCGVLIKKYDTQQMNVRNNREYESLSKEIEFQNLEIQLCEKRIKEFKLSLESKKESIEKSQKQLDERQHDLDVKNAELSDIVTETEKEESLLQAKSVENQKIIEDRLLTAYKKIRKNARNGLAVVVIERDACGGCFNKIPPQRQLDIRMHKKIIVCEYCGRILVDPLIVRS